MEKQFDIVIIGAGLSGSFLARELAEKGYKIKIVDKRKHIGGNLYDKLDEFTGQRYHCYGPHIFHTDNEWAWEYFTKYADYSMIETRLQTSVYFKEYDRLILSPFSIDTIYELFDTDMAEKTEQAMYDEFTGRETVSVLELISSDNVFIRTFGMKLWENDYSEYTMKQWGISEVDKSIFKRVPFFLGKRPDSLFMGEKEGIPTKGFTSVIENMLNHKNITVQLDTEALIYLDIIAGKVYYENQPTKVIYTGALDELFNYCYGELDYRSLKFAYTVASGSLSPSTDCGVTVYPPQEYRFTRVTDYGKLTKNYYEKPFTLLGFEYPIRYSRFDKTSDRYYPKNSEKENAIHEKYCKLADNTEGLYYTGRLADFKYYDMDQTLLNAKDMLKKIIEEN